MAKDPTWRNRIVGHADVAPGELKANARNFRKHPEGQAKAMAAILDDVGFVQEVIVNKRTGNMIDGHLRVELAVKRGEASVPVKFVDLSEDEERLVLATFDPISGMAETDRNTLSALLGSLPKANEGMLELMDLLTKQASGVIDEQKKGHTDPDAAPPITEGSARCRAGDIWQLGPHRLAVGDSTDQEHIKRLAAGRTVDLLMTDPPYNVDYGNTPKDIQRGNDRRIMNDSMGDAEFLQFLTAAFSAAIALVKPGGGFYIFHSDTERVAFETAAIAAGFDVKQNLIWVKSSATLSRQDYNWRHEPVLYGWKPGAAHYFGYDYTETTVVDDTKVLQTMSRKALEELTESLLRSVPNSALYADKPARSALHPTMKPVELIERLICNSSRRGETVLDLFGGAGSTLIASDRVGRVALLSELDTKYADVICQRYLDWSEVEPVEENTGDAWSARKGA